MKDHLLYRALIHPDAVFREIARTGSPVLRPLLKFSILLVLLPPLFAWIGATLFGWRLGGGQALVFEPGARLAVSVFYGLAIAFGFFSTVVVARWMAGTYGARTAPAVHFAFFTVVALPLAVASAAHLYPNVFFNVLVLLLALIRCMSLLYRGLPIVMDISPERGMLMSSALVGWLLVAAVSLLGISVGLWTGGIGPRLGV